MDQAKLRTVVLLLSLGLALSCARATAIEEVPLTPVPKPTHCPKLDSALYELMAAADRSAYARQHALQYEDGAVRVTLELASDQAVLPSSHRITIEERLERLVRALVPVDNLCELSNDPSVRMIRVPTPVEPAK